jgi:hypothetical protein
MLSFTVLYMPSEQRHGVKYLTDNAQASRLAYITSFVSAGLTWTSQFSQQE